MKLLINSTCQHDIENHPEYYSENTVNLYHKTLEKNKNLNDDYIIAVDLTRLGESDYSIIQKVLYKDGVFKIIESEIFK